MTFYLLLFPCPLVIFFVQKFRKNKNMGPKRKQVADTLSAERSLAYYVVAERHVLSFNLSIYLINYLIILGFLPVALYPDSVVLS